MQWPAVFLLAVWASCVAAQDCTWSINVDLPEFQPLYIKPGASLDIHGFWLPQSGDVVTVPNGQQVLFACVGDTLAGPGTEEALLTCAGGTSWTDAGGNTYAWSSLSCGRDAFHTARYTNTECDITGAYRLIEIGFEVLSGDFYKLIETCLHYETSNSLYSYFVQTPEIGGYQSGFPRPSFLQGSGFYPSGMSVDTLYTQNSQRAAVAQAVGSDTLAGQYVQDGTDYYMSRGHLTAKADFIYGSHQRATFWFMNVAPQWQTFNGANWGTLEFDVRNYANVYANDLHVYTGTHGVTSLPDVNGNPAEIYLDWNNKLLKCPYIFWKVVYDPVTQKGVAFGGLNDPYEASPGTEFYLCPNVCDQIGWLTWDPTNQYNGYTYCCEVPAMAAAVEEIPPLTVTGLLT